jgi:adenylosuccinate synthase
LSSDIVSRMAVTIIIGSQWGDEGKGKIIDFLAEKADFVVRSHGGNNAGHTVINQYGTFPMHLIPSGIFARQAKACITNGVVMDLEVLVEEIELLEKAGFKLVGRLFISPRCHIIMPYHKVLDKLYEEVKGKAKTGTTGRGIGPVYADKVSYNGIRIFDLLNPSLFSEKLSTQLLIKNKIIQAFSEKPLAQKEIETTLLALIERIKPYIQEPYPLLLGALKDKRMVLYEGAHGVFLDNDWGTYPFVTASTVLSGGITAASGVPTKEIEEVVGVVKAYTTRVGAGPFPTELFDETGDILQKEGREFGVSTGRRRRCGWFDAGLIRFAAEINGFTKIALTKLDVLDTFSEIKVCTGYEVGGRQVNYYDGDASFLDKVKPVYKTMKGWKQKTAGITRYEDLPLQAKEYIKEIERQTGVSVAYISTGPAREEIIVRHQ